MFGIKSCKYHLLGLILYTFECLLKPLLVSSSIIWISFCIVIYKMKAQKMHHFKTTVTNHFKILNLYCFFNIFITSLQLVIAAEPSIKGGLTVSTHDITLLVNNSKTFYVQAEKPFNEDVTLTFLPQYKNLINIIPQEYTFLAATKVNLSVDIIGIQAGHLEVSGQTEPNQTWINENVFLRITVANSQSIIYISLIFGWIYFLAWSISFYPQIWYNFQRKSVVGLNFDFLFLNVVGFALYSIFNCALYYDATIQAEYAKRYPRGVNPVLLNDVGFSLHASAATLLTIIQCFMFERGEQRVSKTGATLLTVFGMIVAVSAGLAAYNIIHWLDFLYFCSYIKLLITIIKYVPQALMNYRRKSTLGWSIGNIILDFTGGILSMLQMILNAYNYDDWLSIFGDPTKFGLGFFSVMFDVFFMLQHYVFYRNSSTITKSSNAYVDSADTSSSSPSLYTQTLKEVE